MNKYLYDSDDEGFEQAIEFESVWDEDDGLRRIAEDAAVYDWDSRDGWEATWPREFEIFMIDGRSLGKCNVEMEPLPSFCATEIKEVKE